MSEERTIVDLPVQYAAEAARLAEALKSRLGAPTGNKIRSAQNKKFRLPTGEEINNPLEVVILDFTSKNEFYPAGFDPKDIVPPTCFAIGQEPSLLTPSINSPEKQADSCSVCPNNQWGSGVRGQGRACKNQRVVAVMPPDGLASGHPIWTLVVSPTALKGFDDYVRSLVSRKIAPVTVVTEVGFDPAKDYPSLIFKALRPIPEADLGGFMGKGEEAASIVAAEPDVSVYTPPPAQRPRR
jgi:hypothetical protein